MPDTEVYRFADLRLDVGPQRLTREGEEIPLPRLSFNVLVALVRAAPNVVSIQQLMDEVWPGLVVNPETVIQRVKLLRDAIGDDPRAPRYVTGLRGRGYQLACEVRRDAPAAPAGPATVTATVADSIAAVAPPALSPPASASPSASSPATRRWRTALAGAAALAVLAAVAWFVARHEPAPSQAVPAAAAAAANTVAVLPFEDLSADGSGAYIALGVPETIRDRIASMHGLTVIAPASSFDPAIAAASEAEAIATLKATYFVGGSVQRQGEALRITARLVDAASGTQLWSARFDRGVSALFTVQEEIAERVATSLRERIEGVDVMAATPATTANLEAYLLFLEGRVRLGRWTVVDAERAAALFERAIELDPAFAAAYAWLYDARMMAADRRRADLAEARRRNAELIERALELDPELGAAYYVRAIWSDGDPQRREADFRKGTQLDPGNGRGLVQFSQFLDGQGRRDEAAQLLERAAAVDPLSPRVQFRLAMREPHRSDATEREALMRRVLERDPDFHPALQRYAKYRWMFHGEFAEAAQVIERAVAVDPENPWTRFTAAVIYLDLEEVASAREVAAGAPQSERAARVLIALREGDVAAAGAAALAGASAQNPLYENWGEAEAIRDVALLTGDRQPSIRYFEGRFGLSGTPELEVTQFRAATFLAQLLLLEGEEARARRLLERLPAAIDASYPAWGTIYAQRSKASVLLLLGRRDEALATLAESFRNGDYTLWWYVLERDPLWKPLAGDPRFLALKRDVRAHVATERTKLAELRAEGAVPARDGAPQVARAEAYGP